MKLNVCFRSLSLLILLVLAGRAFPATAQDEPVMTGQCRAVFGEDVDEFDMIELTEQQESAIADLEDSLETQFEQLLTPEQRQLIATTEERFEAGLASILTPEQQALAEEDALDEATLSPEQQREIALLEEELWSESEFVLTDQQEERFDDYEENREKQLAAILTAEQQAQFERNQFSMDFPEFSGLQLTAEQRQQVLKFTKDFEQRQAEIFPEITPQQEEQLIQLEESYEQRLFQILTPEQQQLWRDADDDSALSLTETQETELEALDQEFETMFTNVLPDLSEERITQLDQLAQRYETQLNSVLTPNQQQQLENNLENLETLEEECF